MDSSTPWAPSMDASSNGLEMAISAASTARLSPRAEPMPISADPAPHMTDFTSAKSRLISPGVVIRSVMPDTPCSSTWSADLNASRTLMLRSEIDSSRSLGMTMRVSTSLRSSSMPVSADSARRRPSKPNGRVDDADGQGTDRPGDARDHRSASGAGATALAGRDEDHVGPAQDLLDLLGVVLGGPVADLGVGARAETPGELTADVELDVRVGHQQRLGVGVDRDELDALEADLDHPVDRVHAAAADADDLDDREVVLRCCHVGASRCGLRLAEPGTLTLKLSLIVMSTSRLSRTVGRGRTRFNDRRVGPACRACRNCPTVVRLSWPGQGARV